ncbi:hypothetical protein GWK47_013374 [Chionoecetes opilio]|uniref:Uncharacterized protein n=1 Tax=Chionoecetes opilio TaxID=41210 RepID=A0A8J4XVI5_CHIOP|nr:hypothetical protein GWK47_013374 [Chionoecetes opilio]
MSCSVRDVEGGVKSTPSLLGAASMKALRQTTRGDLEGKSPEPDLLRTQQTAADDSEDGKTCCQMERGSPAPDAVCSTVLQVCAGMQLPNALASAMAGNVRTCEVSDIPNKAIEEEPGAQQSDFQSDVDI